MPAWHIAGTISAVFNPIQSAACPVINGTTAIFGIGALR
jgi:hypothetical protein